MVARFKVETVDRLALIYVDSLKRKYKLFGARLNSCTH